MSRQEGFEGARLLLLHSWSKQKADYSGFAEYEQKTTRQIPVIILTPVGRR